MTFISATLNHFRALKNWADSNDAQVSLDVRSFEVELKARNRYYRLFPQFLASIDGRYAHVAGLATNSSGLIGWLPYRPFRWNLGGDKLLFKQTIEEAGHRTPRYWTVPAQPDADYIYKRSQGSFGYELYGPYRAGQHVAPPVDEDAGRGTLFAEQFIRGQIIKVWFWGDAPFFTHLYPYPTIKGDGSKTVGALLAERLRAAGPALNDPRESRVIHACLAYQACSAEQTLAADKEVWLDYRYGRRFENSPISAISDNALDKLPSAAVSQIHSIGRTIAAGLMKEIPAPVLYAVDGVLDPAGDIWWLEVNSNPIFPPDGYPLMLRTLFGPEVSA